MKSLTTIKQQKGFTLIELLVVIGILAVLLSIVLVAINPSRQFSQANNTQRRSDVTALINAIYQYAADNSGSMPAGMPAAGETADISITAGATGNATGATFCSALVPTYIAELPQDPTSGTYASCSDYNSGYRVTVATASGGVSRITVTAPGAELTTSIGVTR